MAKETEASSPPGDRSSDGVWNLEEWDQAVDVTVRRLRDYVDTSQGGHARVTARRPPSELARELSLHRWIREGGMDAQALDDFLKAYLSEGTRLHHPGYLAHQCATPDLPAALADLVHGVTNNAMSLYEMGASAATVELTVIDWMLEKVGWRGGVSGGVLVHGGSLANLTALLAARARAFPGAWTQGAPREAVILAPASCHLSIRRAAAIMGLGCDAVVGLPCDSLGRVVVQGVHEGLAAQARRGRTVVAVVANACAPATGLYDDLVGVGQCCRERGVWFHVDAAHGGSALLDEVLKSLLKGIEQADSIIWDAHKMMRTSTLAAAVLLRRKEDLDRAFRQEADYLFFEDERGGPDLMQRTVEGAKAELGLKLFLNLAWRGEAGLARYVAGRHATAHRLWALLCSHDDFETPFEPQSNVVCFRHRDAAGDSRQVAIRDRLISEGHFHLASSVVSGTRWLRATVMAPATDEQTLHSLLDAVRRAARDVGTKA
ncbi:MULTISPECIES: pyridoxal phosphate-dependent decarboxylase family protein [Myxococcus]|uniref:pyridoxal phosphate-dependent decarboxylase family protein n=1 Tax=Myxococcus TaxID=32 RepID=UPI0013D1D28D|nr:MULTISPECIES: pyridoxal-dependent decarboxylase [Myxococcus]NVJ23872.1 diaminobutyrate decarboxylase [Myxococcus sp. AM011]